MADGEISLASAALAVALTALVIAIGQLLQQIFSTAEGYRRCQDSVIGDWALRTRLRWRWSQFRFEVKFTTPELVLQTNVDAVYNVEKLGRSGTGRHRDVFSIDCTGRNAPSKSIQGPGDESTDLVGWINLLKQLQLLHSGVWEELEAVDISKQSIPMQDIVLSPGWVPHEWSWDLMPPDIIRPLATTTVGTLVVLAHRMGMVWRDLRPSLGFLRAEGNGHSISATLSRGMGLLVQYTYDESFIPSPSELEKRGRIPTEAADKLACGIIPGFKLLGLPDINLVPNYGLQDETPKNPTNWTLPSTSLAMIASSLQSIGVPDHVNKAITEERGCIQLVSELRSMLCPFLPIRGSTVTTVFNALRADIEHFAHREARIVIRHLLKEYLHRFPDSSPHLHGLLSSLDTFDRKWHWWFENTFHFRHDPKDRPPLELIEFSHDIWDETTVYFQDLQDRCQMRYLDLAIAHLELGVAAWKHSKKNIETGNRRDKGQIVRGNRASRTVEHYSCYSDEEQLNLLINVLENKNWKGKKEIVEAWWTLIVRGIFFSCTLRYLPYAEFPAVPSTFHASRTPIYIT